MKNYHNEKFNHFFVYFFFKFHSLFRDREGKVNINKKEQQLTSRKQNYIQFSNLFSVLSFLRFFLFIFHHRNNNSNNNNENKT